MLSSVLRAGGVAAMWPTVKLKTLKLTKLIINCNKYNHLDRGSNPSPPQGILVITRSALRRARG